MELLREIIQNANQLLEANQYFWLKLMGVGSVLLFFGSMAASFIIILRLPSDYFLHWHNRQRPHDLHWVWHIILKIIKNMIGIVVFMGGIAMLFLPGPGLLTILIALMLIDFPYRRQILDRIIQGPKIRNSLNWIRKRWGRPPFRFSSF